MIGRLIQPTTGTDGKPCRPLASYLLGVLLLQASLLIGMQVSPVFAVWQRPRVDPGQARSRLLEWRRSVYSPRRDPGLQLPAPPVRLRLASGKPLALAPKGEDATALVFVGDGNS